MNEETREIQVQDIEKQEVEIDAEPTRDRPAFVPRADIYETEQEIVVVADMPGVDEHSLDITLEKGVLTLNGAVEPEAPALGARTGLNITWGITHAVSACPTRSTRGRSRLHSRTACCG